MSSVTTLAASELNYHGATLNGTSEGYDLSPQYTAVGFDGYYDGQDPEDAVIMQQKYWELTGDFSTTRTTLASNIKYYYRAHIRIDGIYYYANNWVDFTTPSTLAVLTTYSVQDIAATTATGRGFASTTTFGSVPNVTGGENLTKRGVCWNTTGSPTVADNIAEEEGDFGHGAFTIAMTGLPPDTLIYVKAYGYNSIGYAYGSEVDFTTLTEIEITTEAVSNIDYDYALGNGTIVAGENITERGFEVRLDYGAYKDSQDGSLGGYVFHSVAGFDGDVTWDLVYEWNGVLTKTITEENGFGTGAFTGDLARQPYPMFWDTLFKCESYTCRAYMVIDDTTYHGDWVAFDTLCEGAPPTDDISEGNPVVPIIPIETGIEPEWLFPEFEWELPEFEFPPWVLPDLPSWEFPDYPPMSFVGDFYYRKPYTKKDLDDLRKKCIIYNKNSVEFALVLRHNMNVLREFFNMMTDYMDKEEFNDFTDLIPPQKLKELYLDPLEVNDFRDMINEFIRNTIDNNMAVNRNFKLIQDGLSDYETESDDAYFKEINSNIKTVTEDNPDVHRLKRKIDSLNQEVSMNFSNIMRNLKVLRARLL